MQALQTLRLCAHVFCTCTHEPQLQHDDDDGKLTKSGRTRARPTNRARVCSGPVSSRSRSRARARIACKTIPQHHHQDARPASSAECVTRRVLRTDGDNGRTDGRTDGRTGGYLIVCRAGRGCARASGEHPARTRVKWNCTHKQRQQQQQQRAESAFMLYVI